MDVTLGPWTAEKSVEGKQRQPLAEAMGDEAWNTVKKSTSFTPLKAPHGKPANRGITISGKLTTVSRTGSGIQVVAKFTVWVDGTFSNVAPLEGRASASGGSTAEDALRATTESRIKMLLEAIQAGRILKAG